MFQNLPPNPWGFYHPRLHATYAVAPTTNPKPIASGNRLLAFVLRVKLSVTTASLGKIDVRWNHTRRNNNPTAPILPKSLQQDEELQ